MRYLGRNSVSSLLTTLFNVLWYLTIATGCVSVLGVIIGGTLHLVGVIDLNALANSGHQKVTLSSSGIEIVLEGPGVQASLASIATMIGVSLALIPIVLLMLNHLRSLMASFAQDNPFSVENVGRIRWIGYLFIVGAALQSVVEFAMGFYLMVNVSVPGVEINPKLGLNFPVVIAGLVILVLAEIFRLGAGLKEDQDLTV